MASKPTRKTSNDAGKEILVGSVEAAGIAASPQTAGNRPVPIALIDLGGQLPFKLSRLAAKLNRKQKVFEFHVVKHVVSHQEMGDYDLPHAYSDEHMFDLIRAITCKAGYQNGVGITHQRLEAVRFNSHDRTRYDVGIITIDGAAKYIPMGRTLSKYVAYLLLCEALCIVGRTHFEHPEVFHCIFDECYLKEDLRECLRRAVIENGCKEKLTLAGFGDDDLEGAMSILNYVRRPSLIHAIRQSIDSPISGFFIGGLAIHVLGTKIAHSSGKYAVGIYLVLTLGLLLSLYYNYRRSN
jgi:hypothetical protein